MGWRVTGSKAGILLGGMALALAAVGFWQTPSDDALSRSLASGTIRIGYAVEAPYAMVAPDGRVTGEAPEFARLIVARMNIPEIRWVQTSFDALLGELADRRFDVVATGMFITPEREAMVLFSRPATRVEAGLATAVDAPAAFASYHELVAHATARVAVLAGSVEETRLLARGLGRERLLRVPDAASARAAIGSGEADVLALSLPTLRGMIVEGAPLTVVRVAGRASAQDPAQTFLTGFAFARGETRLRDAWNAAQAEVEGTREHLQAIAPFGFTEADLAGSVRR